MINSVTVGFFMSPEILRVGFFMDFPKSVGFSMVVFFMVVFFMSVPTIPGPSNKTVRVNILLIYNNISKLQLYNINVYL